MAVPLPLFPLRTVLFPHMPLSLHVFEDRYRQMLADCLDAGTSFGVIGIREGSEAGGEATLHDVGTLAKIVHVQKLDDGRMNLLVTGASRFRVIEELRGKPYMQARVEYLSEGDGAASDRLRGVVGTAFERYVKSLQEVVRGHPGVPALPDDAESMAYLVAATLENSLAARQQLLEATNSSERLELELRMLRREEDLVKRRVLPAGFPPDSFSLN